MTSSKNSGSTGETIPFDWLVKTSSRRKPPTVIGHMQDQRHSDLDEAINRDAEDGEDTDTPPVCPVCTQTACVLRYR